MKYLKLIRKYNIIRVITIDQFIFDPVYLYINSEKSNLPCLIRILYALYSLIIWSLSLTNPNEQYCILRTIVCRLLVNIARASIR